MLAYPVLALISPIPCLCAISPTHPYLSSFPHAPLARGRSLYVTHRSAALPNSRSPCSRRTWLNERRVDDINYCCAWRLVPSIRCPQLKPEEVRKARMTDLRTIFECKQEDVVVA